MTGSINHATGFAPRNNPTQKAPLDVIRERAESRRIAKEEMRRNELTQKVENGQNLSKEELNELRYLTFVEKAEKLADAFEPKVCYLA